MKQRRPYLAAVTDYEAPSLAMQVRSALYYDQLSSNADKMVEAKIQKSFRMKFKRNDGGYEVLSPTPPDVWNALLRSKSLKDLNGHDIRIQIKKVLPPSEIILEHTDSQAKLFLIKRSLKKDSSCYQICKKEEKLAVVGSGAGRGSPGRRAIIYWAYRAIDENGDPASPLEMPIQRWWSTRVESIIRFRFGKKLDNITKYSGLEEK